MIFLTRTYPRSRREKIKNMQVKATKTMIIVEQRKRGNTTPMVTMKMMTLKDRSTNRKTKVRQRAKANSIDTIIIPTRKRIKMPTRKMKKEPPEKKMVAEMLCANRVITIGIMIMPILWNRKTTKTRITIIVHIRDICIIKRRKTTKKMVRITGRLGSI